VVVRRSVDAVDLHRAVVRGSVEEAALRVRRQIERLSAQTKGSE